VSARAHALAALPPAAFTAFVRTGIAKWSRLVKASGARAD